MYDRNKKVPRYELGEPVWVFVPEIADNQKIVRKLQYMWHGPYRVTERLSAVNYRVQTDRARRIDPVVHVERLKPYRDPEERPMEEPELARVLQAEVEQLTIDQLPVGTRFAELLATEMEDDEDMGGEFPLTQEPQRPATPEEQQLVGRWFHDGPNTYRIFWVAYHPQQQVMVAWYEQMELTLDGPYRGSGLSQFSSIPEVQQMLLRGEFEPPPVRRRM
jgi:hypothetical protein